MRTLDFILCMRTSPTFYLVHAHAKFLSRACTLLLSFLFTHAQARFLSSRFLGKEVSTFFDYINIVRLCFLGNVTSLSTALHSQYSNYPTHNLQTM